MAVDPTPYRDAIAARYPVSREGVIASTSPNCPRGQLACFDDRDGYPLVDLRIGGGKRLQVHVHRLVALFHLPPRPSPRHEIRHLDGDRRNPDASNLTWGTQKENAEDRDRHGRTAKGVRHYLFGKTKLNVTTAAEMRAMVAAGVSQKALAERYGVSEMTVSRAIRGIRPVAQAAE